MTGVNADISDLFFNSDHSNCETHAGRQFIGYDPEKLADEAGQFIKALLRIGVQYVPTVEDLCNDFRGRQ